VIVQQLVLCADGQTEKTLDLTGDLNEVKKQTFIIKEGCKYKIMIKFYVQREIVSGLKYVQKTFRKGIKVDNIKHMVGSYAPKSEMHEFVTKEDEAPSGLLARGTYTIKSLFTDDDKHEHLKWEWHLEIKKDWA
jgi:predicted DNA-binding antitoxin AbrB/MazE fold protein